MGNGPGGLLISAGGSLIHGFHIARILVQRGGAIATVPDVLRLVLESPDSVNQFGPGHVTTGSGIYLMRDKRGRRRMFRGIVSHEDGPHTNPELLKSGWAAARSGILFPLAHLDPSFFTDVVRASESYPIHLPTKLVERKSKDGQGRYKINFHRVRRQSRALLGSGFRELVDMARAMRGRPEQLAERDGTFKRNGCYDTWRNGSVEMFLNFFSGEHLCDFQSGAYALMSPLSLLFHGEDEHSVLPEYIFTVGFTSGCAPPLLVWLNAQSRGGLIVADPQSVTRWKLKQGDVWIHSSEEVSAGSGLFLLGSHRMNDGPDILLAPQRTSDGGIAYSSDPVALAAFKELLGTKMRTTIVFSGGFMPEDEQWIRGEAPLGANAFMLTAEGEEEICGPCGHVLIMQDVRVDYYRVTPERKYRYLTADEIVSQHERYLDAVLKQF